MLEFDAGDRAQRARNPGNIWWARLGSNQRPRDYESPALTTELQAPMHATPYRWPLGPRTVRGERSPSTLTTPVARLPETEFGAPSVGRSRNAVTTARRRHDQQVRLSHDFDGHFSERRIILDLAPAPTLTRRVSLRPVTSADAGLVDELIGDPVTVARWSPGADPHHVVWGDSFLSYCVVDTVTGDTHGVVSAYQADLRHGHAHIRTASWPDPVSQQRTYEGWYRLVDHLFEAYPFHKLYAEVLDHQLSQISSGAGRVFEVEGTLRGHVFWDAGYLDLHVLGISRSRWNSRPDCVSLAESLAAAIRLTTASSPMSSPVPESSVSPSPPVDRPPRRVLSALLRHFTNDPGQLVLADHDRPEDLQLIDDLHLDVLALAELGAALDLHSGVADGNGRLVAVGDVVARLSIDSPLFSTDGQSDLIVP